MIESLDRAPLFCPADRPDRFAKALACTTSVILDLEDAVAAGRKVAARTALIEHPLDPDRITVRLNPVPTAEFELDLAALRQTAYRQVMLAKCESARELQHLNDYQVIALCETAAGVIASPEIARVDNVISLMWGAEDLVASLGGRSSRRPDGGYGDVARVARANVLLAGGAAGKPVIDAVFMDTNDLDGLVAECEDAVAVGFRAKACIHPSQVPHIRRTFQNAGDALWAHRVVAASAVNSGVFLLDGQMIDEPLLRQARIIISGGGPPTPRT